MLNFNNLDKKWQQHINNQANQAYFKELLKFLEQQRILGSVIYPKQENIFKAFELTSFENLKVVILGQDPYHGKNQAHGLSFSVNKQTVKIPPSLKNIYKELNHDVNFNIPDHGCLQQWAEQGVLLLNTVLTVEQAKPNSHANKGWETFTDSVISKISTEKNNVVFILWGNYAQKKASLINSEKHFIIKSAHPSPFSAYNGFFGSKPFSQTNNYLKQHNKKIINWQIDNIQETLFK